MPLWDVSAPDSPSPRSVAAGVWRRGRPTLGTVRQFASPRFWLTLLALAVLFGLVTWIANSNRSESGVVSVGAPSDRELDFVAAVESVSVLPGFGIIDGRANSDFYLIIDATRTMLIKSSTPGENKCPRYAEPQQCIVAADLLGDGVLWFSLIPGSPAPTVQLPAVVELLEDGWVKLANGWVVRHAPKVERSCIEDTPSLRTFIATYGERATSWYNVDQQRIVKVTCPRASAATTSATTTTATTTEVSTETTIGG